MSLDHSSLLFQVLHAITLRKLRPEDYSTNLVLIMNDFGVLSDPPLASQMSPENDEPKAQYFSLPKTSIERSLNEYYYQIRATIEGMANDILRLGNPKSGHIITRWDLQRVQIDVTGTIFKPHPYASIFREEESEYDTNRNFYAPVITIPLPRTVLATDNRVKLLRDALLYDESGEFGGPRGIPFRQHPIYRLFTLEFTNQYSTTAPSRSLWCPSTMVYLPDPRTIFSEDHAGFVLHDTWNVAGLRDWGSLCKKARKSYEKQVVLKANKHDDESAHDGGAAPL